MRTLTKGFKMKYEAHHKKIKNMIDDLGYMNVSCDEYLSDSEFVVFINHKDSILVEKDLPMYIQIYGDFDSQKITVTKLISSWLENEDEPENGWEDLETMPFSWHGLEKLIVKYHNATY